MYFNHKCLGTTTPRCSDDSQVLCLHKEALWMHDHKHWQIQLSCAGSLYTMKVLPLGPNFWKWWVILVKVLKQPRSAIPCFTWSLLFSTSVMSNYLWPHGLQHAQLPCPLLCPGVCSNSCPLSRGCHPTVSSSVAHFSSWLLYCWNSEYILKWCQKRSVLTGTTKLAWGFISGKRFFTCF